MFRENENSILIKSNVSFNSVRRFSFLPFVFIDTVAVNSAVSLYLLNIYFLTETFSTLN